MNFAVSKIMYTCIINTWCVPILLPCVFFYFFFFRIIVFGKKVEQLHHGHYLFLVQKVWIESILFSPLLITHNLNTKSKSTWNIYLYRILTEKIQQKSWQLLRGTENPVKAVASTNSDCLVVYTFQYDLCKSICIKLHQFFWRMEAGDTTSATRMSDL